MPALHTKPTHTSCAPPDTPPNQPMRKLTHADYRPVYSHDRCVEVGHLEGQLHWGARGRGWGGAGASGPVHEGRKVIGHTPAVVHPIASVGLRGDVGALLGVARLWAGLAELLGKDLGAWRVGAGRVKG